MAFPGSHIKFAAKKEAELGIEDKERYYSGTIYPDSRYATGIERSKTHSLDLLPVDKFTDDFKLGWSVHQLCDHEQAEIIFDLFPKLNTDEKTSQWWIEFTAVKLAQDFIEMKDFGIKPYLSYISHVETFFEKEDPVTIRDYFGSIQQAYQNLAIPETYNIICDSLHINETREQKVISSAESVLENDQDSLDKVISELYN